MAWQRAHAASLGKRLSRELTETDLERAYRTTVDPRLNYEQALEIAMLIVRKQAQLNTPTRL